MVPGPVELGSSSALERLHSLVRSMVAAHSSVTAVAQVDFETSMRKFNELAAKLDGDDDGPRRA